MSSRAEARLALLRRSLQQIAHPRELFLRKPILLDEVCEKLYRRAAINLVEHPPERRLSCLLALDEREVDVGLPFSASVRDVALELQRPNHRRNAGVGKVRIDLVAHFVDRRFAELPED